MIERDEPSGTTDGPQAGAETGPIVVWIDDPELEEMIPLFLENRHKDVAALREAVAAGDAAVVRRLGHNMKGAGAGYGFDRISAIGATLERAAIDEDRGAMRDAARDLARFLERVEVRLGEPPAPHGPEVRP